MSYLVLARKYRPKTFEEMVGQKAVVQTLQNAIKNNRVAQAYLFSGMRGVGKTTAARILAKALNCKSGPTPTPCNACDSCLEIAGDRSLDVLEIDGASNGGINDIRALRETVKYKAMHDRFKIIIIDEVHQVTGPAFNALLKTLEEPPPGTIFIFATTEFNKVPATIVSRCQHFEFKKVSHKDIINHLMAIAAKEQLTITPYGLGLIAEASEGSIRDSQSLLDQAVAFCGENIGDAELKEILGAVNRDLLFDFSTAILEEKADLIFSQVEKVVESGYDLRFFYKELIQHFRNLLVVKSVERAEDLLLFGPEDIARIREEAKKASSEDFLRYLQALQNAEPGLKFSSYPQIYFETALIKLCHFKKLVELKDLIRDIGESKKRGTPVSEMRPRPPAPAVSGQPPSTKYVPKAAPAPSSRPADVPPASPKDESIRRKDKDMETALKDPGVRLFMDRMKAQILSVEPPKGKAESEEN
jgi:DNA polymerase-3 subunit gamma/tau